MQGHDVNDARCTIMFLRRDDEKMKLFLKEEFSPGSFQLKNTVKERSVCNAARYEETYIHMYIALNGRKAGN